MDRTVGAVTIGVVLAVFALAMPASAHHSFALEYDGNKPTKFEGVVTKLEWTNPHARIYVDVTDATGKVNTWNLELASLSVLVRNGWTRTSVKIGERVKVEGFEARAANTYRLNATSLGTSDGRVLFSGTAGEDGRPQAPTR